MRKILRFGGDKLRHPSYTWFYGAGTTARVELHGHPGDEVLVVSADEIDALRAELWKGIPADGSKWTEEHRERYHANIGARIILEDCPHGTKNRPEDYEEREQAEIILRDVDPLEWLGLSTDGGN